MSTNNVIIIETHSFCIEYFYFILQVHRLYYTYKLLLINAPFLTGWCQYFCWSRVFCSGWITDPSGSGSHEAGFVIFGLHKLDRLDFHLINHRDSGGADGLISAQSKLRPLALHAVYMFKCEARVRCACLLSPAAANQTRPSVRICVWIHSSVESL